MKHDIAFCGLNCSDCAMYIATQNDDDEARAKAAEMLRKAYGMDYKPEEINCDGCHTENGRLLGYCSTCKVRTCGMEEDVENCAHCSDQPCENLAEFHSFSSNAKSAFEKVLKSV